MTLTGVITEIIDDNKPGVDGRPPIYKKIATIDLMNGQSANVEFFRELRTFLSKGFKINDRVQVECKLHGRKNRLKKTFNNVIAISIQRI
ncbi:hypothetical protein [Aquimarina macrocephali]|uniref:hypothetical protein n=1 Tax=Aquimarina macrocephali TaxID=666563 RepID=UPI003F669F74